MGKFEEPQWGLKRVGTSTLAGETIIRRTPMGIETVEEKLAIGLAREIVKELKGDIKARLLWERTEFRLDVVVLNRQEFKEYAEWKAKREAVREPK